MSNKHGEGALTSPASQTVDPTSDNLGDEPTENSDTKYILVLGPRGSGKSTFVSKPPYSSSRARQEVAKTREPCTKRFYNCQSFSAVSKRFAFIDSPGFDNKLMNDEEIFVKLMAHLSSRSGEPMKLTGIIYIHPQDDDLGSRTLWRNLDMLTALIGHTYRERVTILVKPRSETVDGKAVSASLLAPQTPFYHFYRGMKNPANRIWTFRQWTWPVLQKILQHFSSLEPKHFHAQTKIIDGTWVNTQLITQLRALLAPSYAKNCVCDSDQPDAGDEPSTVSRPSKSIQEQKHEAENPITGDEQTEEPNAQPDPNIQEQELASQEVSKESVYQEVEILKGQLRRAHDDYALLYSDLQVQDNVEESRITGALDDINHLIEGLGVSVSEHVNEVQSGTNVLAGLENTSQLQELLDWFGHIEGKSSLVRSATGAYMAPQDFFDYAIRTILCQELYRKLFKPFHPALAEEDDSITQIYDRVRRQEPQPIAGRWRRDAFNAINHDSSIKKGQSCHLSIHEILTGSLNNLLKSCSEPSVNLRLTDEQIRDLDKLGNKAEEFNQLVKGSVVYLGDFHPVIYSCGDSFELPCMSEPQLDPTSKQQGYPPAILATIAFGLVRRYALGRGQRPEETMMCKATIVSERLCQFL